MKTKTVKLLNRDFVLAERKAIDILDLIDFATAGNGQTTESRQLFTLAYIAYCGLKNNYEKIFIDYKKIPIWRFINRHRLLKTYKELKKLLSWKNLMNELPTSEILEIVQVVYELEGVQTDDKKKVDSQQGKQ